MKEEWLMSGAAVPVDVETTAALVAEIKRLIDVVGGLILKQGPDYERGFVDGMQKQMQSSVDKAVNTMSQPQQEPVDWGVDWGKDGNSVSIIKRLSDGSIEVLAWEYAPHPPQHTWVGLTDEEALECWPGLAMYADCAKFWGNIESKLKAKNDN